MSSVSSAGRLAVWVAGRASGRAWNGKSLPLAIVALAWWCSIAIATPDAPARLAVEDRTSPIGIGAPTPAFSWTAQDLEPGAVQSGYRILVASTPEKLEPGQADKWDSGEVDSSQVAYIVYAGKPLHSREICYWKVRTRNGKGEVGPWSPVASFEMGLLSNSDWGVPWVWRASDEPDDYTYFRKGVTLDGKRIVRARIYVSAVHRYELYVNGELVGKGPNFAYPEEQYYQTWDIGPQLQTGKHNVFGLVGHWYGMGQGRPASRRGTILKAIVDYADGTTTVVGSDSTWKVRRGPWVQGRLYRNNEGIPFEHIDARQEPLGWKLPGYDDSAWANAIEIGTQPTPPWTTPLRAQDSSIVEYDIAPASVKKLGPKHYVADFGKIYAGMPKVTFRNGKPGDVVNLCAGYRLRPDGGMVLANDVDMNYLYVLRGGEETFRPYWYQGFRYMEVRDSPSPLSARTLRMIVRHNKVDERQSSFESSDRMLNAVWDLAKRSTMLTLQEGVGVDLSREQAQWGLDAWHVGGPAMTLFGERNLVRQGIREFAQSQTRFHNNTGKINCVYPNGDGRRDIVDETQGCMHWVWEYYQQTGDKRLLGEVFDKFVRVADWEHSTENPRSGLMDLGNEQPYGGGYVGFPSNYGYDMKTTQRTVLSVSTYLTYRRVSQLASELGHHDVQNRFARYAEALATAIQTHLWSDEQRAYVDGLDADGSQSTMASQQANMMVLAAGLATGDRKRGAMEAVKRAGHRTSGILVKFLIQAYGDNDEDEALMDFLLNPSGHNWAYIVRHDGSMAWEDWRTPNGSATENVRGTASESFPLSVNGAVTAIQDYVLGMTVLAPQCRKIAIRPHPGDLRFARGAIPTQQGPVAIAWNHDTSSATFRLNVDIPVNVRADVYVPKGNASRATVTLDGEPRDGEVAGNYVVIRDIGSGKHEFVGSHQR